MKKELNVSLFESKEKKIYGIIDKELNGYLVNPYEFDGEKYAFESYIAFTSHEDQGDHYINPYTDICIDKIKRICSKQNVDVNEIEKLSVYTESEYSIKYYIKCVVNMCRILGIKYLDWYQKASDDPKGYYCYEIDTEKCDQKTEIHLELIKGCVENKENVDGILYDEIDIDKYEYNDLLNIIYDRYNFIHDIIFQLTFIPDFPCYKTYLHIPENIHKYITEFGTSLSSILASFTIMEATNRLYICSKDKSTEIELNEQIFL